MKKTLIALAALAATGAFAQSSVTIFGTLDASVQSISKANAAGQDLLGYVDGAVTSSIWGLKGSEDMGGGMKANFELISDIQTNNGGMNHNGLFRRAANVSLAGGFGEVALGIKTNPLIATHGTLFAVGGNSVSTNNASAMGFADFFTRNAVTYTTPNMGGLQAVVQYGMSNNVASNSDGSVTAWSLSYVNGPLALRAAGQDRKAAGAASSANTGGNKQTQVFGGTYTMGKLTLSAAGFKNTTTTDVSGSALGLGYAMSPALTLGLNLLQAEGSKLTNVQARYAMSKRTTTYVQYGLANNDTAGKVNYAATATNTGNAPAQVITGFSPVTNANQTALGFGVMHSF